MTQPITLKADWQGATAGRRGDTLYANDLNNNFNTIQQAVNNLIANGGGSGAPTDNPTFSTVSVTGNLSSPSIHLGGRTYLTEINGDTWLTANAFWDGANWQRVNTAQTAIAINILTNNNIPGEANTKGLMFWRAVPAANPISPTYATVGGWELIQGITEYKDWVCGGFGLEVDGNGTFPYGRFIHFSNGNNPPVRTGIVSNIFADLAAVDDATQPSWFFGRKDDSFVIERAPVGQTTASGFQTLLTADSSGHLLLSGNPTQPLGAAPKQYVDAAVAAVGGGGTAYLPLAGGAMTGPITLAADPAAPMQPATKQYADTIASNAQNAAISAAEGASLPRSGGALTGNVSINAVNAGVELGATSSSNTPFIDFHSSGNAVDFDTRLIGGGGSGTPGAGQLSFVGAQFNVGGALMLSGAPTAAAQAATKAYADAAPGFANVKTFGATGTGGADDTAAIVAAAAASRSLYFPPGVYNVSSVTFANGTTLLGAGIGATTIVKTSASANLFTFQAQANLVADMQIVATSPAQTGGFLFDFAQGNSSLRGLLTIGGYNVVVFRSGVQTYITDCTFDDFIGNGIIYSNGYIGFAFIQNLCMAGDGVTSNGVGLWVQSGDTFAFSNVNISGMFNNIVLQPVAGGVLANVFCSNVLADGVGGVLRTTGSAGWVIDGTASSASLDRVYLTNCWAGSNVGHGFQVQGVSDFRLIGSTAINNQGHGVWLGSTPSFSVAARIQGCTIAGNSHASSGTNGGIYVDNNVSDFSITDCKIGPTHNISATQKYGVWIPGPTNDRYIVANNMIYGNVTGGILDSGLGTNKSFASNIVS